MLANTEPIQYELAFVTDSTADIIEYIRKKTRKN